MPWPAIAALATAAPLVIALVLYTITAVALATLKVIRTLTWRLMRWLGI